VQEVHPGEVQGVPLEDFLLDPPAPLTLEAQRRLGITPIGVKLLADPNDPRTYHVVDWVGTKHYPNVADFGLVFPTQLGTPLRARNVVRDFKALLARAGFPPDVRVHDLRHTASSLLLASGTDAVTAAAILGHAQPSTTLNVYGPADPANLRAAAERLGRTLRRRPPGPREAPASPEAEGSPEETG
jgi:integrase